MQGKGAIKLLAAVLLLACIYQLSFSLKTRSVEKKAAEYAASFPEEERAAMEQYYLDSIENKPVYNVGITKFTYKQCKEKEVNLGLDLKGGMNVMLEIQVEDVVKSLAGDSQNDPAFKAAIEEANKALKAGTGDYIGTFAEAYSKVSGGAPLVDIFISPDRKDIKAGLKTILEGIEKVKAGISIWIFPEGTRNCNESELDMLEFKEGSLKIAEKSGHPVIPVAITGTADVFEAHIPFIRPARVIIEYGAPIYIKQLEPAQRKFAGEYTRKVIYGMLEKQLEERKTWR